MSCVDLFPIIKITLNDLHFSCNPEKAITVEEIMMVLMMMMGGVMRMIGTAALNTFHVSDSVLNDIHILTFFV